MQTIKSMIALVLLATLCFGSLNAECPANSEFTTYSPCDYICGVPCDFKGVTNMCICRDGYLKDTKTNQCVPENQCSIGAEVPVLRAGPTFTFSCFTT
uniref:TIL domain-containing protein n=1 Tax=Anopheles minimus TaxID=112268 RepID=A0A182W0S0_9DIPT